MKPLVSVVMPAYNGEKYIRQAIGSVLDQTYEHLELVIVEDRSTDHTLKVIQEYDDPRISLYLNPQNKGIAYSTNLAISKSQGKYIALLDDDDMMSRQRLEWQAAFMEEHEEIDILGGRSACIDQNGDFLGYVEEPLRNPKYIKANLLFHNRKFANCTAMIRKSFLEKNGLKYRDKCLGMQDFIFYIESSKLGNISSIDRLLHYKRIHGEEVTALSFKYHAAERAALYAQFQRESLEKSGFRLSEEHLRSINEMLPEGNKARYTREEFMLLYRAFGEILKQAQEMQIDYYIELEQACKKILGTWVMPRTDIFNWDISNQMNAM